MTSCSLFSVKRFAAAACVLAVVGAPSIALAQVKIGSSLSVTGPASFLGDPEKKTLEMYVDEINKQGGVNGQKLELVVYDDGGDANAARTFATGLHPLGRLGAPHDIADAFVYLASDEAAWVTGTALTVDGGLTSGIWGG